MKTVRTKIWITNIHAQKRHAHMRAAFLCTLSYFGKFATPRDVISDRYAS
jgi:hypothetical protein